MGKTYEYKQITEENGDLIEVRRSGDVVEIAAGISIEGHPNEVVMLRSSIPALIAALQEVSNG